MPLVYNSAERHGLHSTNPLVRHQEIREALKLRGYTMSDIARELGISPASVTTVSQGYRRSARVEERIAQLLDTTAAGLFPERYEKEGQP